MEKVQYTMIDRQIKKPGRSDERGAALVVAIAIMTILLAVALTFYAVSRAEVDNAINVKNQVQVDLLLDGTYAMAQAELNRDFLKHPNATTLDAAPFSLFNGSWAVGKQWALRNGIPLQAGGVPLVNLSAMPLLDFGDGLPPESMFNGGRSKDWLTIPRFEDPTAWGANPIAYANVLDFTTGAPYVNIFNVADRNRAPFVTPAFYGPSGTDGFTDEKYPLEWIHTWTDVDNDLDGLNDAIWIPLPQDRFFSGGEVVDDATGRRMYDDGVDNDLDSAGLNGYDELPEANEGAMELASFVYHGLGPDRRGDGLDNDGNGVVDDPANENKYFLTAPLPGLRILLDLNADGKVPDLVPNGVGALVPITVTLPNTITAETAAGTVNLTAADVDAVDNDFDMLINDYQVYAYVGPNTNDVATSTFPPFQLTGFEDTGLINPVAPTPPVTQPNLIQINENVTENSSLAPGDAFYLTTWRSPREWPSNDIGLFATALQHAYEDINLETAVIPNGGLLIEPAAANFHAEPGVLSTFDFTLLAPAIRITHSGEPVCDLAGRAAITIRDESSKVNLNVAGGHSYDPIGPVVNDLQTSPRLGGLINSGYYRALGQGATSAEFETRTLPGVGVVEAAQMWLQRTGVPGGNPASWDPSVTLDYGSDVIYPGYGRTDDNANALLTALNARDDDGDGLVDEGLYLPELSAVADAYVRGAVLTTAQAASAQTEILRTRYADYFAQLGAFEGVDEPGELQRFNPAINTIAEGRNLYDRSGGPADTLDNDLDGAINELGELGDLQLQDNLQLEEIFGLGAGATATLRQSVTTFSTDRNVNFIGGRGGIRAVNKLDFNFATPQQIAANLVLANNFQSVTAAPVASAATTNRFAEGLRQKDVHLRASGGLLDSTATFFPADPVLQAMQAAVDIVDNRDPGHARSVLSTERQKLSTDGIELASYDFFPTRLGARERAADTELFPLGVLEDHLRNTLEQNRKLEVKDDWWTFEAAVVGESGTKPEVREISYTASGNEAIRINEIMVRPVRRIEAEAVPQPNAVLDPSDPMTLLPVTTPLANFDPSPDFGVLGAPSILPEFAVARLTSPPVVPPPALGGWTLFNGGVLGEASYLGITVNGADPDSVANANDILEFVIAPTDGLPPGRYYLTINTTTNTGVPTVVPASQLAPPLNVPILQSAVKYRSKTSGLPDGNSIVQDIVLGIADGFRSIDDPQIGGQIPGAPAGWTFVDGTRVSSAPPANYHFDGVDAYQSVGGSETYTITVPEAGSDFELHIAFRVNPNFIAAIGSLPAPGLTYTVAINSLDFSQEPDHEWVEVVNVSDDIVDIGGWQLEVGIPDRPSVPSDPFKSIWTVPASTKIAPRGTVLLAFNKFDTFQDGPAEHKIADNGMGLADGDLPNPLVTEDFLSGNLTVPPIGDNSLLSPVATLQDLTGSVFRRRTNPATGALTDYVDNDGDGRTSLNAPTDTDNLADEGAVLSSTSLGSLISNTIGNQPWDRIIQLDSTQIGTANPFTATPTPIRLDEVDTLDDVSAFVLKGGALPNYPEQDGYDNDGDGGYVLFEQIDERTQNGAIAGYDVGTSGADGFPDWIDASKVPGVPAQYIPGTLDLDMVDNDFDGFVDERPYQADFFGIGVDSVFYRASLSEGVDEGRNLVNNVLAVRRFGAGSFEAGILPLSLFPNRQDWNTAYATGVPNPPFTVDSIIPSGLGLQHAINTGYAIYGDNTVIPTAIPTSYQGSDADPQDWKAFSERRWYPGDNVVVTLYERSQLERQVVDRVTYRESDVTNRTIDDVVTVPYVPVDLDLSGTAGDVLIELPGLNSGYTSFWLPNQMGLDFYRSLERKDPLYNGDRFGTENRWQATDGNYDDWADSLSYFEAELVSDNPATVGGTEPLGILGDQVQDIRPRFVGTHPAFANVDVDTVNRNIQLYGHAMSGSPLRMNAAMRRGHNPQDLELIAAGATDSRQFPSRPGFQGPFDYFRTHEDGPFDGADVPKNALSLPGDGTENTKSLPDQRWNHSRAFVANRPFQSPADLMRVPHQMYLHDALNTSTVAGGDGFLRDMTLMNYQLQGDTAVGDGVSVTQDIALRGATLGQDLVDDTYSQDLLAAAMNSMAVDSTVLTMGQAEFHPIRPQPVTATELDWVPTVSGGGSDTWLAPAAWAPVFLFELDNDNAAPTDTDHFSNYPAYVNGVLSGANFPLYYLFDRSYIIDDPTNFAGNNPYFNNNLESRWPLEKRTAMFVSEKRDTYAPPEALFTWDGADGLENGEYVLYIGTFLPQMRDRIEAAARASAQVVDVAAQGIEAKNTKDFINSGAVNYVLPDGSVVPVNAVTNTLLIKDPTSPRKDTNGRLYDPVYAIDVITDPSEARGEAPRLTAVADPSSKPGGLIHPDDWNPTVQYRAGADGYIPFGNNATGGWQPQIVRVTNNFLAIRVRNVGAPGDVGVLTHVVLSPRKRTAGRVNVNTALNRVSVNPASHEYFSTLLGLPGVVNVAETVRPTFTGGVTGTMGAPIPPDDAVGLMTYSGALPADGSWTAPDGANGFYAGGATPPTRNRFTGDVLNPDSDLLVPNTGLPSMAAHQLGAYRLNAMLQGGRTEHADGRYYESVGDLTKDSNAFDYDYTLSRPDVPDLAGTDTDGVEDWAVYPLSNDADPARRFDEVQARLRAMGNLITTRSDVFEIIMTVEAGYGVDQNRDGFINYRDRNEFVTTAATKATATYERRSPSDQSDSGE